MKELFRDVVITNELGLHARSAAKIAEFAKHAKATVWIIKGGEKADASSVIDILTLACPKGSRITIKIEDPLDVGILDGIEQLLERGLGE